MAKGTNLAVWLELQNQPLGAGKGENFGVPMNYTIPPARIYVVNQSRTHAWKRVVVPVSDKRGAEEALIFDKELAKIYNVDTLYKRVEQGKDMNRYKTEVAPVIFSFRVGGVTYAIPPARDANTPPPRVEVKEGAWDIFLGNYDRMRAVDKDGRPNNTVIGDEKSRLSLAWSARHKPVFKYTDDGDGKTIDNPYGFLEFVRETVKPMADIVDKEYLSALDLLEV